MEVIELHTTTATEPLEHAFEARESIEPEVYESTEKLLKTLDTLLYEIEEQQDGEVENMLQNIMNLQEELYVANTKLKFHDLEVKTLAHKSLKNLHNLYEDHRNLAPEGGASVADVLDPAADSASLLKEIAQIETTTPDFIVPKGVQELPRTMSVEDAKEILNEERLTRLRVELENEHKLEKEHVSKRKLIDQWAKRHTEMEQFFNVTVDKIHRDIQDVLKKEPELVDKMNIE